MRVLVVEDEPDIAESIIDGFGAEGWATDWAADGEDALFKCSLLRYDVVVLDRDLPKVHGDAVCRELVAQRYESRILMLTASGTVSARVEGLEIGADDYLSKPFAFDELIARVRALARRPSHALQPVLEAAGISLDSAKKLVTRDGTQIKLNRKELGVLEVLLTSNGAVVSTEELLDRVWDEHIDPFTNTVRVTVMTLRRKLGQPVAIETVVGIGYRIVEAEK